MFGDYPTFNIFWKCIVYKEWTTSSNHGNGVWSTVYNRLLVQYFSSHSKLHVEFQNDTACYTGSDTMTPLYALITNIHFLCLIIEYFYNSLVQALCFTYLHVEFR